MTITEPVARPAKETWHASSSWDVAEAWKLREQINPATGRNWTNADLARLYNVTTQAVGKRFKAHGFAIGGSVPAARLLPWTIATRHKESYFTRTLRLIERRRRGEKLSARDGEIADRFLDRMRDMGDMVVYYDPDQAKGFVLRPRRPVDGDALMVTTK